jgi:hypothetical protein
MTTANTQDFLQAYIVTMKNGSVYLAFVMSDDFADGKRAAISDTEKESGSIAWDVAAYPLASGSRFAPIQKLKDSGS